MKMTDRAAFFAAVRKAFGALKQSQVDGFTVILDEWARRYPDADPRFVAYSLATTWHETDRTMQPIEEYGRGKGKVYGNGWWGRGFVQITWQANYEKAGKLLGVELVKDPRLALRKDIAAAILVQGMVDGWFTGKRLSHYFTGATSDPKGARRIINGMDRAELIAGHHAKFLGALAAAQRAEAPLPPPDDPGPPPNPPVDVKVNTPAPQPAPSGGLFSALGAALHRAFPKG